MVASSLGMRIAGQQQINRMLSRFGEGVSDYTPALEEMGDYFLDAEGEMFRTGGRGRWQPLAASTVRRKGHARILIDTGRLRDSLTQRGRDNVRTIRPLELIVGTRVRSSKGAPYPLFHQTGTSRMPARPPIDFAEDDKRTMTRLLQRYLVRLAKEAAPLGAGI